MLRTFFNFSLALEGVAANKLRAILTALGIVFGVAAVIAMLAIGTGAKQSILEQMKLIGTNNIVVKAVVPNEENQQSKDKNSSSSSSSNKKNGQSNKLSWSPGLTMEDAKAIMRVVPGVELISPEIVLPTSIIQNAKLEKAKCVGITNAFFEVNNLDIGEGSFFHDRHIEDGTAVCVIGKNIQTRFFSQENPVGQKIKCGNTWLTIIGVLEKRIASDQSIEKLGIRDYNADVYVPVSTALLRFKNRAVISKKDLDDGWDDGQEKSKNYHQLDRMVIRVQDSKTLQSTADVIARLLKRRHQEVIDYELEIPELLLEQQQKTQDTFNLVLAVIAGISLLVGGIGIMNIMLASVLERIKEIGVRRSLGATQKDIVLQFLFEAIFISLAGGVIGMILGITAAKTIASYAQIPTVISMWSLLVSFGVAAAVGLVFGIVPARRAAKEDPIKALRTE